MYLYCKSTPPTRIMHNHILHCDQTLGVHDILCMQTTFIVDGMCVALSNFSSVLLPCLRTSNHTQHASNYTQGNNTWIFSSEDVEHERTCTMYTPTSWTDAPHFFSCFPFHKFCLLLKACVCSLLIFLLSWIHIFVECTILQQCKENRWSFSPFRL